MKYNLRWQLLLATVGFGLVLALLSFQVQSSSLCEVRLPAAGGTVVDGVVGLPQRLNPLLSDTNPVERDIASLVFDGLTRYDADGRLVPDLAASWTVSDDGRTVRFVMRDSAVWQDNTPVTADDVAFTYGLLQDERFPAPAGLATLWANVVITVEDPQTVTFTLPAVYPPFMDATTRGLLPAHLLADVDPAALPTHPFNQAPIGTGPFQVENGSWVRSGRMRLLPNPAYWRQSVQVEAVELRFYPDGTALVGAFAAGDILAVNSVMPADLPAVASQPNMRLFTAPLRRYTELVFNLSASGATALADVDVRRALAAGTNRDALIDAALNGQGIPLHGPYLPFSWVYDPAIGAIPFDPVAAAAQLADAGWTLPGGTEVRQDENAQPLLLRLLAPEADAALADALAAQWRSLGVFVEPILVSGEAYLAALRGREFDLALLTIAPAGDPDLYDLWSQDAIVRGQNFGAWNNRRASEALEAGRQTWDLAERRAAYATFQRLYDSDVPALTLFQHVSSFGVSSVINNVDIGRIDTPRDRYATLPDWFFLYRDVTVLCPADDA